MHMQLSTLFAGYIMAAAAAGPSNTVGDVRIDALSKARLALGGTSPGSDTLLDHVSFTLATGLLDHWSTGCSDVGRRRSGPRLAPKHAAPAVQPVKL